MFLVTNGSSLVAAQKGKPWGRNVRGNWKKRKKWSQRRNKIFLDESRTKKPEGLGKKKQRGEEKKPEGGASNESEKKEMPKNTSK